MDRLSWHDDYGRPGSSLARRLHAVQVQIRAVLDSAPPGPLKVISLCAGQGRDLLEVRWLSGPGEGFGVGVHRFAGSPQPLVVTSKWVVYEKATS